MGLSYWFEKKMTLPIKGLNSEVHHLFSFRCLLRCLLSLHNPLLLKRLIIIHCTKNRAEISPEKDVDEC